MTESSIKMLPIDTLHPHPKNPRTDLGDLSELTASIKENGVMQNLTVVPDDDGYTVVIGHRRMAAAKEAGFTELPCAVVEMSEGQQMATMLLENMQRSDLSAVEQAQGVQLLLDMDFSIANIAKKTGFSESTVRRRAALAAHFDAAKLKATQGKQVSFADYEKLYEIDDYAKRNELLEKVGTANFNNEVKAAVDNQKAELMSKTIEAFLNEKGVKWLSRTDNPFARGYNFYKYLSVDTDIDDLKLSEGYEYAARKTDIRTFYVYMKADREDKKSAAEREKKDKERQRQNAFTNEAREINQRVSELRKDFIRDFSLPGRKTGRVSREDRIIKAFLLCVCSNEYSADELLDFDEDGDPINFDKVYNTDGGLRIMLTIMEDCMGGNYINPYNPDHAMFDREDNAVLNRWYYLLSQLGYEMSDEEKQLRDGTHEIFTKYKKGSR